VQQRHRAAADRADADGADSAGHSSRPRRPGGHASRAGSAVRSDLVRHWPAAVARHRRRQESDGPFSSRAREITTGSGLSSGFRGEVHRLRRWRGTRRRSRGWTDERATSIQLADLATRSRRAGRQMRATIRAGRGATPGCPVSTNSLAAHRRTDEETIAAARSI
jgi:hypothetical protein